jgi:Zn-dependent protease with chaperone function
MRLSIRRWIGYAMLTGVLVAAGCSVGTSQPPSRQPSTDRSADRPTASSRQVDPGHAERLRQVMVPLIQHMNKPLPLNQVRVGLLDSAQINAANAGAGEFYVTTGLLERASDDQLRGVMAHEVAHADLGHVAKAQALGVGLNIGIILLDQIIPGSGAITPLAGELVARGYSRKEEYAADAHGATILQRAGHDGKGMMINTLSWLKQTSGDGRGGFFSTHPGTGDRIEALQKR